MLPVRFKYFFSVLIPLVVAVEDPRHWKRLADDDIHEALEYRRNNNRAKNVILFIGDGMDLNTVTSTRIYKDGEDKYLAFDKFPNVGLLKTYSANKLVPDSGSTATALFSGVKVNHRTIGVDAQVPYNDCEASLRPERRLTSIMDWAQAAGKSTGFVTTTRVTHATPSALYSHTPNRNWECEAKLPANATKCKDIARQLVEDAPGKNINVIFGGGRQELISHVKGDDADPIDLWACYSSDGRNLIHEWEQDKQDRGVSHAFVQNRFELLNPETEHHDFVLGIFSNGHMYMRNDNGTMNVVHPRESTPEGQPSLAEMTEVAIKVLQKNHEGFVLMVEGGLIDYAHHRGHARSALEETAEFSRAVKSAVRLTREHAADTLIIVTSDHGHSMLLAGYPDRQQGVLGLAQRSKWDAVPYTTLLYGTGGPNNYQFEVVNGTARRRDPSLQDTTSYEYSQQTGMVTDETVHSGTDVVVYAKGPMAHLFHSVHEQTHVAYVIAYAARIGPYSVKDMSNFCEELLTPGCQVLAVLGVLLTTIASTFILF